MQFKELKVRIPVPLAITILLLHFAFICLLLPVQGETVEHTLIAFEEESPLKSWRLNIWGKNKQGGKGAGKIESVGEFVCRLRSAIDDRAAAEEQIEANYGGAQQALDEKSNQLVDEVGRKFAARETEARNEFESARDDASARYELRRSSPRKTPPTSGSRGSPRTTRLSTWKSPVRSRFSSPNREGGMPERAAAF